MEIGNGFSIGPSDSNDGAPMQGHSRRLRFLSWAFLGICGVLALCLIRVHANPDSRLTDEELSHIGEVELRVPRGEIHDREGNLLAKDRRVDSLWADPRYIPDPAMTAVSLSHVLNIDEAELRSRLMPLDQDGQKRKFVWVKRWLTEDDLAAYRKLDPMLTTGLSLKSELVRFYPEGELAAHILGFVNKEGIGSGGIEMSYDKQLRCTPGKRKTRVDARRQVIESLTLEYVEQEGGENVELTIDKGIQRILEQELDRGIAESKAPRAMGLVMDPKTGAILAMACRPAYNPNDFSNVPPELYKNRAVVDVFEPGSSFKIVTFAAALEHGLVSPEMKIDCENGSFNPYGHRIRDFHKLGVAPVSRCFAESSNIATIKLAAMLTPERLEMWVNRFGFGNKTSRDFPLESRGLLHPRSQWSKLTMGAIPIGQEIAVTMPQLARAFSVIANGGLLVEPYLVERVVDTDGSVSYQHTPPEKNRVLSEKTAHTMRELCHLVVLHGTGKPASIPEYRVGGKTGTAQIARPDGKGFYPDKYTAVFAGFAPVSNPRLCAVVVVCEPDIKLHYGGSVSGPLFKNIVRDALIRMQVPPDPVREGETGEDELPNIEPGSEDQDVDTVVARSTDDVVPMIEPDRNDMLDGLELMAMSSPASSDEPVLPDLKGLTKRQVKQKLDLLGIHWDSQGAGRVVNQEPPAGTALKDVTVCRLHFANQATGKSNETKPTGKANRS